MTIRQALVTASAEACPSLIERARVVAVLAAAHAEAVDAEGRFPIEAIEAAKSHGLLGAMVPVHLGGEGASAAEIAEVCFVLGGACASTAMIYAMHQVKAACVVRHARASAWHAAFLRRLAARQLLLASSTTEGKGGGDVRSSSAALEPAADGSMMLERAATVMSYGLQADAVVTTARRSADAAASDQVLVVFERADYRLEPTLAWNTLGMRGTSSAGFAMRASGSPEQVLPQAYADIHVQTMTPTAHLFWSSVWAGVAASAVERARRFTRKAARGSADGQLPPGAPHLVRAGASLRQLRALVADSVRRFEALAGDPAALSARDFQTAITLLKVDASELALATVMSAMRACGLSGYRTDGEASLGRHLRDILSAPVMINNERILADAAASALLTETPTSLFA